MTPRTYAAAITILALASVAPANAASIENGRRIVQQNCAVCHAVGVRGESRNREAPPFRELHQRYPVEMLAEALAEGILSGHPAMPQFTFPPHEVEDIIAYLQSIQTRKNGALPPSLVPVG
jgi:mono/diheme cytochrome c family protein